MSAMPTREYVCPDCHQPYQRVDLGRRHPEWETMPCFDCAKQYGRQRSPLEGAEYAEAVADRQVVVPARPVRVKGRRWNTRTKRSPRLAAGSQQRLVWE